MMRHTQSIWHRDIVPERWRPLARRVWAPVNLLLLGFWLCAAWVVVRESIDPTIPGWGVIEMSFVAFAVCLCGAHALSDVGRLRKHMLQRKRRIFVLKPRT